MKNKPDISNFVKIPESDWPPGQFDANRMEVWFNPFFLVQVFKENAGVIRLTINATNLGKNGMWKDGIGWDELQQIKNALGYEDQDAVEIFPRARDLVNVANMRHLWVLPDLVPYAWRR